MARICPLFSSSGGNSFYISASGNAVIVDAGMNAKQLEIAISQIGEDADKVRAVLVTHEHTDHIGAVRVFSSKHKIPVYGSAGTLKGMQSVIDCSKLDLREIDFDGFEVAGMVVLPFHTSHDSRESNGYRVETPDGRSIGIATDMGYVSDDVKAALPGCDAVLLESNHDLNMLRCSSYPYHVKRRIMSGVGHLSNDSCAEFAKQLIESGTTRLILGHLSRENNLPSLAYQTTKAELDLMGAVEGRDYVLKVAKPINDERVISL
ncbi:MAG: MBL fold metallo-hydrolase [Clostridiales bacterium]|nr:MBL fold metallo-hydrolase [Clostridia bacterium]MCR4563117.1 MBL fold metallo-hydrolase [Clostridiales bacterium]